MKVFAFALLTLASVNQVSAADMTCQQAIERTHKSLLDIESADPDVIAEVCGASRIACAYPYPTPAHPDRMIVLYSNDYVGEEAQCIVARAARDIP